MKRLILSLVVALVATPVFAQHGAERTVVGPEYPLPAPIVLAEGTTYITEPIVLGNGGTLRGAGGNTAPLGSTLVMNGPGPAVIVEPDARFWVIENLRIISGFAQLTSQRNRNYTVVAAETPVGFEQHWGIWAQHHASNYRISNVYVAGFLDGIKLDEANFLARIENVFSDANLRHGFDIGADVGYGGTSTTITITATFSRFNGSWGYIFRNIWGLTVNGSAADVNGHGGWLLRDVAGVLNAPTAESNPIGFWFWGLPPRSRVTVFSPTVDCDPSIPCTRYLREVIGSANIINSEIS